MVSLTYRTILSEYINKLYKTKFDLKYVIPLIEDTINKIGNFDMNAVADYIIDIYYDNNELSKDLDYILWEVMEEYERKVSPQTIVNDLYKRYGEKIFENFEMYYDKEINSIYMLNAILQETNYSYVLTVLDEYLFEENNIIDEAFKEILFKELEKY